ncbi:STAS/SEC14 domain-containing protein [Mycobacterium sp. C31M]
MIEVLTDMPAGVTGIRVSGRIDGEQMRAFQPTMDQIAKAGEIRIVEVIEPDYEGFGPGGLTEDLKMGLGALLHHHSAFKRIAVVADREWITHTIHAIGWLYPGEISVFGLDRLDDAKQWAAG